MSKYIIKNILTNEYYKTPSEDTKDRNEARKFNSYNTAYTTRLNTAPYWYKVLNEVGKTTLYIIKDIYSKTYMQTATKDTNDINRAKDFRTYEEALDYKNKFAPTWFHVVEREL